MISQTHPKPQLFQQLLINRNSLFVIVSFMDCNDIKAFQIAIRDNKTIKSNINIHQLLTASLFTKQYLNKIDRTIPYFMYENTFIQQVDNYSVLNIAQNSTSKVSTIMNSNQNLFQSLTQKCSMNQQQVNSLIRIITQPDLPLPISMRSQIGKYCNSNFQLFLCAKITNSSSFFSQQSQFQKFKNHILDNQDNYLINILSSNQHHKKQSFSIVQKIKQLSNNPQKFIENLSNDNDLFSEKNEVFNFFIIMCKLAKNMVESIKLRLQSVSYDPYVYFTELMLRYSLYKFSMLELEESFGSIFTSFESIIRETLNIRRMKNQVSELSLWKLMMGIFRSELEQQISKAIPIYMNLAHKMKIAQNNELYQNLGLCQEKQNLSQKFEQHEGSVVLEYLMNDENIDNAQVYLTDFVQMLIDLSVDEYNVLLCGHSHQFLGGLYDQWEQAFLNHQTQILTQTICVSQNTFTQEKHLIESQLQFINKKLNIKPKTLKQLFNRINIDKDTFNFQSVDKQLTEINRRYFGEFQELHTSQKSHKSSLTADDSDKEQNYEIDLEGLQYFSEIDEEETIEQIDV